MSLDERAEAELHADWPLPIAYFWDGCKAKLRFMLKPGPDDHLSTDHYRDRQRFEGASIAITTLPKPPGQKKSLGEEKNRIFKKSSGAGSCGGRSGGGVGVEVRGVTVVLKICFFWKNCEVKFLVLEKVRLKGF